MTNYIYLFSITLLIFIAKLNADTIYVSTNGSDEAGDGSVTNPFLSIQKGIDEAVSMDTVYVTNGIYEGGVVISNKTISLIGESREETKINQPISSPQISIIDCQVEPTRVQNFIIKRGNSNNGGGIYSSGSTVEIENVDFIQNISSNNGAAINSIESTVKVQNSTFSLNTCDSLGGAIYVDPLTTCEIYNSSFTNNVAWNGGAIATVGGGKLLVQESSILNNNASGYNPNPNEDYPTFGGGGGIYQEWSDSLEIYDSEISNNTAANAPGGGIAIYLSNDIIIDNIILNDNSSAGGGGGVMFLRTDNVLFENSTIANNISQQNSGGGIFIGSESGLASIIINATFNKLSIFNNYAMSGGGIFSWSTILNLYNSTLAQNEATDSDWSGGGLASHYVSEPNVINSLFYNNIPNSMHNGYQQTPILVTHSLIQEEWAGQGNLIDIDPLFTDPENEDFTLQTGSPCIDAGTSDMNGDGSQDYFDFNGDAPDIGSIEWVVGAPDLLSSFANNQDSSVILTWNAVNHEDFQYYRLQRSLDSVFSSIDAEYFVTDITYTDGDVEWNHEYFYRVSAYLGYWTEQSNTTSILLGSLDLNKDELLVSDYKVYQNFPNPFNPVTTLTYELPRDNNVKIVIYDMMGRVVKNLLNVEQRAGSRSIQWNATNNTGASVSAGMYIYMIQIGDFKQINKMLLIK